MDLFDTGVVFKCAYVIVNVVSNLEVLRGSILQLFEEIKFPIFDYAKFSDNE